MESYRNIREGKNRELFFLICLQLLLVEDLLLTIATNAADSLNARISYSSTLHVCLYAVSYHYRLSFIAHHSSLFTFAYISLEACFMSRIFFS